MAWPSLPDCRRWNENECRAVGGAYTKLQNWISQYVTTGQIPTYASTGCAGSSWNYMRKWCAAFYNKFAEEARRLEAAKEQARLTAAAEAAATALDPAEARAILEKMVPPVRTEPLVKPDAPEPGERRPIPWGLVMVGGAGLLLAARMMRRRPSPAA